MNQLYLKKRIEAAIKSNKIFDVSNLDEFGKKARIMKKASNSMNRVIEGVYSSNFTGPKNLLKFGVITKKQYEDFVNTQGLKSPSIEKAKGVNIRERYFLYVALSRSTN